MTAVTELPPEIVTRARGIRLLSLDVDGVMSDGKLFFSENGEEIKAFNVLDGLGVKLLQAHGVTVAVITGRKSQLLQRRCDAIGIRHVYQGKEIKLPVLQELAADLGIAMENIAHMGDDLPDLPIMRRVGLGLSVPNGHVFVREHAHWISEKSGGCGAVREACEMILSAQGQLQAAWDAYL